MLTQFLGAALLAGETAEVHQELPMPALVYAGLIMGGLLVLMFITLSFSNLGNRHEAVEEHADPHKQHPNKHDHGESSHH